MRLNTFIVNFSQGGVTTLAVMRYEGIAIEVFCVVETYMLNYFLNTMLN
ncbi:Uncharacterised protein [Raoultella terrigena]|uniref:Uncharacterized protein n=1 Tax=Raoultella terrigena TaxID=577 RepID=A0A4U9D1U4_RAOTE|nr:Uncharacterised protein [Raoultella terrigena]